MLEFSYNTVGKLKAVWLFWKLLTAYFLVVELIKGGVTSFELNYRKSYHVGRTKGKVHNSAYGSKAPPYLVTISSDLWLLGRLRSRASNLITTASMIAFAAPVTNFFPGGPRFYHLHLDSCQYSSQAHWSIVFLTIISPLNSYCYTSDTVRSKLIEQPFVYKSWDSVFISSLCRT